MPNPYHQGEILIGTPDRSVWVPQSAWFAFCDRITQGETPPQRLNSLRSLFNQYIDSGVHDGSNETLEWFQASFNSFAILVYPPGSLDVVDVAPAMIRFPTASPEKAPETAVVVKKRSRLRTALYVGLATSGLAAAGYALYQLLT